MLESGETRNMSSSGVLFRTGAHLEPGDVVEYVITLHTSPRNVEVRLKCKGKVVRRADGAPAVEEATETAATLEKWEFLRQDSARPF